MRYPAFFFCLFIGLGLANVASGQSVNFEDGFEDGDFTNNPTWSGDTGQFTVIDGTPNYLLQLQGDSENGDVSYISTSSSNTVGSWEFFIDLDFSPSDGNRADIFLMSSIANLEGSVNGYALRAGESGSNDVFRIVRYDGGSEAATILSGTTNISNGGRFRVKVTRQSGGDWILEVAEGYDGQLTQEGGTQTDNTYSSSSYFGVRATYTSSRFDLFKFDFKIDLPPFTITKATVTGSNSVDVAFNRAVDQATVSESDFSVNKQIGSPSSVSFPAPDTASLTFSQSIPSNQYTLSVDGVSDQSGNQIQSGSEQIFIVFGNYADGDIIINEFMFDPPSGQSEYVELKNRSNKYLDLAEWQIGDDTGTDQLGSDSIVLEPNGYLVISSDTTSLYNTYGTRPYYAFGGLASFNNSGDAVQLRKNSGSIADSLTYTSDWDGDNVALERRSASTASIYQENWGNSPNPDGGTPGTANEIAQDNTAPKLTDFQIVSDQTLKLAFDERLDTESASNSNNYSLNGISINSTSFISPDSVEITLGAELQNAQNYTLSIAGLQDIFANSAITDTTFTFYKISPVSSGDLFINEFSYEPSTGSTEYIEIYNPTSKSFDLQGWTLSDNRANPAEITDSQFIIPPDSFAVIAPDNTLLSNHPDIALVAMGSNFPALNNSGDDIVIRNSDGTKLDSLRYTSDWGGDQIPLERRTIDASGTFQENWVEAPDNTGSPGMVNNAEPDQTPPFFSQLYAVDASTLQLIFSEEITSSSATNADNFDITPQRGIQLISANKDSVTLFLDEPLNSGEIYEVTASNISDIFGNTLSGATKEFEFLKIDEGQPSDIVINEILYYPDDTQAEFIELYNASDKNFELTGWQIGDKRSETSIEQKVQIQSGEFIVVTSSRTFASQVKNAITVSGLPALNGDSDAVYVQNKNEITIDSLYYHSTWGGDEDGTSLERKDPLAASNDASNWQTSSSETGISAGSKNVSYQSDTSPPKVIFSKVLPSNNIEVRFNEFIQLTDSVRFLAGGQELEVLSFDPANANIIVLESPSSKAKSTSNTITVQNLVDVKGNSTMSSEVSVAQRLQQSDLVINEIMYNPLDESDDNQPDQSEYLELRNTKEYAISLEGLVLHDAPDEDGNIRELQPVTTTAKWVPAKGHVLLYADQVQNFEQSKVANFFELESPNKRSIMRIERSSLSLASTGDAIYIADSTGATIDSVYYSESWQNPNIIDPTGVALERITPAGPSNDDSNWGSSVNSTGGTPNSENSIYQSNQQGREKTGISFAPNPFSPDNDGYEDNLVINYKLDHQDYLINVQIYDRYGRLVRELADGKQAGFEGELIWDGRKDDGSRNRIGIYIIVFEAYDSASGSDKSFKKTVVLARKLN